MGISPHSNVVESLFHLNINNALIKLVTIENDYLFSKYIISINGVTMSILKDKL